MTDSDRRPLRGDVVRVRTREEILATLDKHGDIDGLPFMPELLKYCGRELPVSARAHKTCDTIAQQGMRRLDHTVFLAGARCDGSAHDGCQAGCLAFWREEWLEWPDRPGAAIRQPTDPVGGGISEPELRDRSRAPEGNSQGADYRCQATEIARASTPLSRKALWQYVADVRSRNVGTFRLLRGMVVDAFNRYQSITAERFPRWLRILGGRPYPFLRGTGTGGRTPVTGLHPGDVVEVRSKAEIEATLDHTNRNRRMVFDIEMVPFCGGRYRVERNVDRILDETTGKMIKLTDCVTLENVVCQGIYHRFCQRATPPYWREEWLRKVDGPASGCHRADTSRAPDRAPGYGQPAQRPVVVVYSGTAWDGLARVERLISVPLSEHADILWVDPPVSPLTRSDRRAGASRVPRPVLRTVEHGIHRLTPTALPLHTRPLVRLSTDPLIRAQTRWALRRAGLGTPHAVIACGPADVFKGWPRRVRRVHFGTDDFVAGAPLMGLDPRTLARTEQRQMAAADVLVATSEVLAQRWRATGVAVTLIPNGAQTSAYREVPYGEPPVTLPSPVAGVSGHLSERIDIALLEALVDDGFSLLLVGTVSRRWEPERLAALLRRPQVQWVGPQPLAAVPSYLRCVDVGITPYRDTDFNRASFPLKMLEYLAAGLPAVSTDLPAVRWLDTDLIRVASTPKEMVTAARAAAAEAHVPSAVAARRAFAERHSWTNRAADLAEAIGLSPAPVSLSPPEPRPH